MSSRRRMPIAPVALAVTALAVTALAAFALAAPQGSAPQGEKPAAPKAFAPIPTEHLHNVHRVTPKLISGSAPEGDGGFEELTKLGVKTIISVDGARPDVARARSLGMRYVHLPIGYDDVTPQEGRAIAKAIDELDGPVYLHCHHGKHRSAAAAAVACVMNRQLEPGRAEFVLQTFGTGANYKGLWASARNARPVDPKELSALKVDYVEAAKVPPMADAMVAIDNTWEHLKQAEKSAWRAPPEHPDLDPPHEALQLVEHFSELARAADTATRPVDFKKKLTESEEASRVLHAWLANWSRAGRRGDAPAEVPAAMKTLSDGCAACHRRHRDE